MRCLHGNTKRGKRCALPLQGAAHVEISQVSPDDRFAAFMSHGFLPQERQYNTISPLDWQVAKLTKTAACDFAAKVHALPNKNARTFFCVGVEIWPTGKRDLALGDFNLALRRKRRGDEEAQVP